MTEKLLAPLIYPGSKRRIASKIWDHLGDVKNYVEPFCGSAATLLQRPIAHLQQEKNGRVEVRTETVNDIDCYITNFWRAIRADPDSVTEWADWPVNEADLHARHRWLVYGDMIPEFRQRMHKDPDYYDTKIAGWWVWGNAAWISVGWCAATISAHRNTTPENENLLQKIPHLNDAGHGIHNNGDLWQGIPHLGNPGRGIHNNGDLKQGTPHLSDPGRGIHNNGDLKQGLDGVGHLESKRAYIHDWFHKLSDRLRKVRVCCGEYYRVMTPSVTTNFSGITGILLDPPYDKNGKRDKVYDSHEDNIHTALKEWCIKNDENPRLRIALCGFSTDHDDLLERGWFKISQDHGGFQVHYKESIWFSPACIGKEESEEQEQKEEQDNTWSREEEALFE